MYQLGGNVTILELEKTHLGRGETISDTAKVLARYIDIIVYRTSSAKKLYELAKHSSVPVINACKLSVFISLDKASFLLLSRCAKTSSRSKIGDKLQ